ncbi:MAG: LysR family transcriptional regulator [Lachnospiraceae bacterium]|nr:LysR family transcriptional regulator [Lachnospiraceae bacterium]
MIEIYLLEQLVSFAKNKTLLRAAEELHISQPALSRSMKKIEEEFGVQLFNRENSKISLNETGKLATEYARRVLEADREMLERVIAFDRSKRTLCVGSCAPFPTGELIPYIQEYYIDMAITSEIADDDRLISGLKNGIYQLAILHEQPDEKELFCQRYLEERIYLSVPKEHPFAKKKSVSFDDMKELRMLVARNIGFWMNVCKNNLPTDNLLIQNSLEALYELIYASSLPCFNSDRMIERGSDMPERVNIPITDEDAHTIYYIACLSSERKKYSSVFNVARSTVIRGE